MNAMTEEQDQALDALVQRKLAEKKAEREGQMSAFMDASDYIYQKHHANYATQMAGKAVGGAADMAANVSRSEAGKMVFTDFGVSGDEQQALRAHDAYRKAGIDLEGRIQRHRNIVRYRSITNDSRTPLVDVTQKYRSQLKFDDYDKATAEAERRNKASGVNTSGLKPEEWPVKPEDVMDEEYLSVVAAKEDTAVGKRYQELRKFGEGIREELRPDWAKKAENWSDAVPHSKVGQMFLDASQNVANLAVAYGGKAVNAATRSKAGSVLAAGTLALSEQGSFLKQADPLVDKGMPVDLAEKYSLEYGALSGAIEYSEQALNVATLGGSGWVGKAIGSKVVPKGVVGKFAKWAAGRGLDAAGEGLEEAWQEALQYYTVEKMLVEWAARAGKKDFEKELEGMSLPLTKEGKVDWKAARGGLLRAFESGMNVSLALGSIRAPVDAYQGTRANVKAVARENLVTVEQLKERYANLRVVPEGESVTPEAPKAERAKGHAKFTDEQIDAWIDAHPDEAPAVAGKDALTRKDWKTMGLDRARQEERARFLARVKARQAEVKPAEAVQEETQEAEQVDETPDETAPDQDEAETPAEAEAEEAEASKAPEALPERLAAFADPDLDVVLDEASAAVEESRKAARRKGKSQIEARLAFAGPASGKAPRIGQDGVSDEAGLEAAQIRRRHSPEVAADVDALHGLLGSAWAPVGEGFDEAAYERAAPHLRNVLEDFSKAGKSPADFAAAMVGEFGHAREYVKRMARDLASGHADVQTAPRAAAGGEVATAPQATQASGERPAKESAAPALGSLMSKAEKANFAKTLDAAAKGRKRMEHLDEQAKKTKFKRTTAKVALRDGKTEDQVGLAYKHVMFHKGRSGWIVTHMASGLGVPIEGGRNDARIAAMRLADIMPEDVSQGLLPDVQAKVRKISRDPYADIDESAAPSATVETPPRLEVAKTRAAQGEADLRGIETAVESGFSDMPAPRNGPDVAQREHAERVKAVRALTPVDVSTETRVENKAEAKRIFAAFGEVKNASDGRVVRFPGEAAGKILRHKGFETGRIVGILNKVFENSLHAWSEAETAKEGHTRHPNIKAYHNYVSKIDLDGRQWFVRFTVTESNALKKPGRNLVHSSFVSDVALYEEGASSGSLPVIDRVKRDDAPSTDKKLAQWLSSVNPSPAQAAGPRVLEDGPDAPMTKGVGAAASNSSGEFVKGRKREDLPESENATGLRESVAEIERRALGMPPEVRDAARRFPEVVDKAWKRMQESSTAVQDLIDELTETPRPLTDVEVAMLTIEKVKRFNARNAAASETVMLENSDDETAKAEAKRKYEVAARRLEEVFEVAARGRGKSITETARGLSALRMMMDDQFDLVSMEQAIRDKQGGKTLSEEQRAGLARIKAEYDAARRKLDAEVERLTEELNAKTHELAESKANADFLQMVNEVTATQEKTPFRKKMLSLADRLEREALAGMKKRGARMSAGVDPTVLVDMGKLGAAYIIRGAVTLGDWTAKMRSAFSNATDADLARAREEAERIARGVRVKAVSEQVERRKGKRGKTRDKKQDAQSVLSREVKELMREQVEAGVTTLDEAVAAVHKELAGDHEGLTPEQVRDAFSDYGKARKLNQDDVARMLADLRRQAQLVASIERVQQELEPLKSGPQRDKPSQTARELARRLSRMMREAGIKTTDAEAQIASALQAKKTRMENAIADLEKSLAEGRRIEPGARTPIENDAEAGRIETRLKELREQYDEAFPSEPLSIEQRLERAIKAAERSRDQAAQRVKDARQGKFSSKEKSELPFNERLNAIRAERDAANAEVERLRELAEPGKKAVEAKKRRLQTAIKEVERRIREKDFSVREQKRIDISGDKEAMAAQVEYERVRNEFAAMKEQARREARTPWEVAKETGLDIMDAQRNILASFDLSAVGRQGWYAFLSHPRIGMKAVADMFRSFKRANSAAIAEKLRSRPNYPLYKQAKLGIVDDDGTGNFSNVEDRLKLNLVDKVPGIDLSSRTYATFLNVIRADVFDAMLANSRDPSDVSREKIQAIARGINELTGRGDLGRLSPETMARFLWAPRFLKSAFDILTFRPLRTGTTETKIIFGKEYLRAVASMTAIYMLAALFRDDDEPIEWDPRSSDFGAIPFGKHKFNPLGFVRPLLTFMARNATGVTKTGGRKRKLRKFSTLADEGAKESRFGSGMEQVWMLFAQSKAHPTIGTIFSVLSGKEFGGKDITPGGVIKDMTVPLAPREIYQTMMIDDPDAAVVLSLMLMLGIAVNPDYSTPEYMRFEAKDDTAYFEARKKRLNQAYESRDINLEELGERNAMKRTADKLSDIFSESKAVKAETGALTAQALEVVRAHNEAADHAAFRRQGIRAAVVMLTDEKTTESDREFARGLLEDVPPAERLEQLRQSVMSSGGRAAMRYSDGSLTPYAKRVYRLQSAMKRE